MNKEKLQGAKELNMWWQNFIKTKKDLEKTIVEAQHSYNDIILWMTLEHSNDA